MKTVQKIGLIAHNCYLNRGIECVDEYTHIYILYIYIYYIYIYMNAMEKVKILGEDEGKRRSYQCLLVVCISLRHVFFWLKSELL